MPEAPVVVIAVNQRGSVELLAALEATKRTSAYAFHRRWWRAVSFFHRDGQRYEVASVVPDRPRGFISRVLASTVYNPRFSATYRYRAMGPYSLADFQNSVKAAIAADDDILTQFHTQKELLTQLVSTSSFNDMVGFVRYMQEPDDAA